MKITENVHLIRKEFQVTPVVNRYVNVYLIEGQQGCYLIDSGVSGTERLIDEYMKSIGKSMKDINGLFLTHSHPDHIGASSKIKQLSNCIIYAPEKELSWIENIDNQFRERPIPNFYGLLSESVEVDTPIEDGMIFKLEEGMEIKCISTSGHSHGSMSFLLNGDVIFIGDAIPVVNDIPIFVDYKATISTIEKLSEIEGISYYCPAWDDVYDARNFQVTTTASLQMLEKLKEAAIEVNQNIDATDESDNVRMILEKAELLQFAGNPLVVKSIEACCVE